MTSAIDPTVIGAGNVDKASVRLQLERARDEITGLQDAQAILQSSKVSLTGDTMTGDLTISKANPGIILNKSGATQDAPLYGARGSTLRWATVLGNSTNETGSNSGSNFAVLRYNDAGTVLGTPLFINRATGAVTLEVPLAVAQGGTGATTVSAARTALGATTVGAAVFTAASAADARTATLTPAVPVNGGTDSGAFGIQASAPSGPISLPAGGTWAYYFLFISSSGGTIAGQTGGVSAGGTTVGGAGAGFEWIGFAWRIA